ncbi:transposase [Streptomyces sp. INA 01156]
MQIEVVRRPDGQRGFTALARRWVVERTLSWLSRSRRLNRDHERRPDHHEQMVWWAASIRLTRNLAGMLRAGRRSGPTGCPGAGLNSPPLSRTSQPRASSL